MVNMDPIAKEMRARDAIHDSASGSVGISESGAISFGRAGAGHTLRRPSSRQAIVAEKIKKYSQIMENYSRSN